MKKLELTGQKFGRLTVLEQRPSRAGQTMWLCQCECGKTTTAFGKLLKRLHVKSCGCLKAEGRPPKHGHSRRSGHSRTYKSWAGMLQRCQNPNDQDYYNYGARGISVCHRWQEFQQFLNDVGERPEGLELDRIESSKNYEPGNVRWATERTQSINRRWTRWIAIEEEMFCMKDAAKKLDLSYQTLRNLTAPNGLYRLSGQDAVNRLLETRRVA